MYSHFNYIPHNQHARKAAKKTLGYNETRKGKDGVEIERKLFGKGGPLTREQAEQLIKNASKNTYFFRWILSPDREEENAEKMLDLWRLVQDGVTWLEERLNRIGEIQFIAAEHDDHTKIPHIHAILLIQRRGREKIITVADINAFREKIHQMALERAQAQERVETQEREHQAQAHVLKQAHALKKGQLIAPVKEHRIIGSRTGRRKRLCWACGYGDPFSGLSEDITRCPACNAPLKKQQHKSLNLEASL